MKGAAVNTIRIFSSPSFLMALVVAAVLSGCYFPKFNFTGAPGGETLPDDVNTISIIQFENQAGIVVPSLAPDITEDVRDIFQSRTKLNLVEVAGDLNLVGTITGYSVSPISITGSDVAAQNRLTINVHVEMQCDAHEELVWESNFNNFADFSADQELSDVEDALIEEILEKLVTDIFNKAFGNW